MKEKNLINALFAITVVQNSGFIVSKLDVGSSEQDWIVQTRVRICDPRLSSHGIIIPIGSSNKSTKRLVKMLPYG